jgi:hypothetical protein
VHRRDLVLRWRSVVGRAGHGVALGDGEPAVEVVVGAAVAVGAGGVAVAERLGVGLGAPGPAVK